MSLDPVQRRVLDAALSMQRHSWEQGVLGHAVLDLGDHRLAGLLARDAVVRQTPDGRLGELGDSGTVNCAANGEAVRALAHTVVAGTPDADAGRALDRQLEYLDTTAPRAADGTLFHIDGTRQIWVDTVYMVVPFLVLTGRVDEAARQFEGHRRRLYDEQAQLWSHQWDDSARMLVRPAFWGSGNGWVVAALARALRHLSGRPDRDRHAEFQTTAAGHARDVIDSCLRHRAPSGLFHDVLDDPTSFEEVTLAMMLGYAIGTGTTDGWLPQRYASVGRDLVAVARAHVDADGFVRPACGAPHFDRPGVSTEAQAFFLLATAATSGDR